MSLVYSFLRTRLAAVERSKYEVADFPHAVLVPLVEGVDVLQELQVQRTSRVEQVLLDECKLTLISAARASALSWHSTDKRRMNPESEEYGVTIPTPQLLAGTYNWTAYYWND